MIISKPSLKRKGIRLTLLIFCSLFISGNALSRKHWGRDYIQVSWDTEEKAIDMKFEFYDYDFGPASEDGYLEYCDFLFSTDGVNFYHLMGEDTDDQPGKSWSWCNMKYKLFRAKMQFNGCNYPAGGTMWSDNVTTQYVKVDNYLAMGFLTMKWFMDSTYHDVKHIQAIGKWHVNGVWPNEFFNEIYDINTSEEPSKTNSSDTSSQVKPKINASLNNNEVKVIKNANAVVINGAKHGDKIHVYTTSGMHIKSIAANNDVVNIKLPLNQIYIVKVGQARYKVAL